MCHGGEEFHVLRAKAFDAETVGFAIESFGQLRGGHNMVNGDMVTE